MLSAVPSARNRRRTRAPQHTFAVKHAPYEIAPFMIAPVMAGGTLRNLSFQSRALTNPIRSPLIGWWLEHYFFYVKLSDIDAWNESTELQEMLVNDAAVADADYVRSAATDRFYGWASGGTGIDYVKACLLPIITTYFRDQDEAWNAVTIDGNPAAYLQATTAFDSALLETEMDTAVDVAIPVDAAPTPDTVSVRDVVTALRDYERLRDTGLADMTYEDYLRSYGVRVRAADMHKPELIRYTRDWQYPSSHVAPDAVNAGESDVTTAVSWVVTERADKARFFREPGFIVGVTCARPKVYFSAQTRPLVSLLNDAQSWSPNWLDMPEASWKKVTDAATDPLGGTATGDWWIDLKDLYLYGDQFIGNIDVSAATDINKMALPNASLNARHPVQASVDALFVSADATGGIRQDGIVRLQVSSHMRETSPRGADVRVLG